MLHHIVCHPEFDQQKDWTVEIGPYAYRYADVESEVEAKKLWNSRDLGDKVPEPKELLQFLRAEMIEKHKKADIPASRIMLFYQSSLGLNDGSTFKTPVRQIAKSAFDVVSSLFMRRIFSLLEARNLFDPDINTYLLRECKAISKKYLVNAPYMLKKDSLVLLWAMVLWAPNNIKGILQINGIVCEKNWSDDNHMERLFRMYKTATWEPAGMKTVWDDYRAVRHFLYSVHQNEDAELTIPVKSESSEE